jgi:transcriptional regulator with XRE-family HTH domain
MSKAFDNMGANMRRIREARGLMLIDLAAMTGISASAISNIERGRTHAMGATLWVLADALEVSIDELLGRDVPGGVGQVARITQEHRRPSYSTERDEAAHRDLAEAIGRELLARGYIRITQKRHCYGDDFIAEVQAVKEAQK